MNQTRDFGVDALDRLTDTTYDGFAAVESATLDLLGNREAAAERTGVAWSYGGVNAANEYASVAGAAVSYDARGNLSVDEEGRRCFYDEQSRLTEIRAAAGDETLLLGCVYDALGRRVAVSERDEFGAVRTRHIYWDGRREIEEWDAAALPDGLLRSHVNGTQYVDERIATLAAGGVAGLAAREGLRQPARESHGPYRSRFHSSLA